MGQSPRVSMFKTNTRRKSMLSGGKEIKTGTGCARSFDETGVCSWSWGGERAELKSACTHVRTRMG